MKKKILIWILTIILALGGVGGACYAFCPPVTNAVNNWVDHVFSKQPVAADNQNTETEEEKQAKQLTEYQQKIIALNTSISQLNARIGVLIESNEQQAEEITAVVAEKATLEARLAELENTNAESNEAYEAEIATLNTSISQLNSRIEELTTANQEYVDQIAACNDEKATLEARLVELENANTELNEAYETEIATLNTSISSLNSRIEELTTANQSYVNQITTCNDEKATLEARVTELQSNIETLNEEHAAAVAELNTTISSLNSQIEMLTTSNQSYVSQIADYVAQIETLESTIAELRAEVEGLEYSNGTVKYGVSFVVDYNVYNFQILEKNATAVIPDAPNKVAYNFKGWSTNGVDIVQDIDSIEVTNNVIYYAVFKPKYSWVMCGFGNSDIYGANVVCDGDVAFYGTKDAYYLLNNNNGAFEWTEYTCTWEGSPSVYTSNFWTAGGKFYYSNGSNNWLLDTTNNIWKKVTFSGLTSIYPGYICCANKKAYYFSTDNQYVFDDQTNTWTVINFTWETPKDDDEYLSTSVVSVGDRVWLVKNNETYREIDLNNYTISQQKQWTGLTLKNNFFAECIYEYNGIIFYSNSSEHYVYDDANNTWYLMSWGMNVGGGYIRSIGDMTFWFNGSIYRIIEEVA